jgi:hypothetical protein
MTTKMLPDMSGRYKLAIVVGSPSGTEIRARVYTLSVVAVG